MSVFVERILNQHKNAHKSKYNKTKNKEGKVQKSEALKTKLIIRKVKQSKIIMTQKFWISKTLWERIFLSYKISDPANYWK